MSEITTLTRGAKYTPEAVIAAILDNDGYLTHAADALDCSYRTIARYIKNYPDVAEAYQEALERQGDNAESRLQDMINAGNVAAIIFYCKTRLRHRGYSEKMTVEVVPFELQQKLADLCTRKGINVEDLLQQVANQLAGEADAGDDVIVMN